MKLLEITQSKFNRATILKACVKLASLGLNFCVIGGAAISIHTSIPARDVDVYILGDTEKFLDLKLNFYDFAKDGQPRHVDIDGVPIHLVYHDDFEKSIESKFQKPSYDKINGIQVLSLINAIETTKRNKIQDKLIEIIKALKLKEDWFKNLNQDLWHDYAVAWDTVNDKSVDDIARWKDKFKLAKNNLT